MKKVQLAFHPGIDIAEELEARWWTQTQFADVIGISVQALNAIIKWHRNITPSLAVRIGAAFWTSAEVWMNMQTEYDIYLAEQKEKSMVLDIYKKLEKKQLTPIFA